MKTKTCTECGETKAEGEFPFTSYENKNGLTPRAAKCKTCRSNYHKLWYSKNKQTVKVRSTAWRKLHPENRRRNLSEWRSKRKFLTALQSSRSAAKKHNFIPCIATVKNIEKSYTGFCKLCKRPESDFPVRLHMDHNHETGKFRGWLCKNCNAMLGNSHDSPELLEKAAQYLREIND